MQSRCNIAILLAQAMLLAGCVARAPAHRPSTLASQAEQADKAGHYADAEATYRRLLETPLSPAQRANALERLGSAVGEQGRLKEAETVLRQALALAVQSLGAGSAATVAVIQSLAGNLDHQLRLDEAGDLYRRALAIRTALDGPGHWRTALAEARVAAIDWKGSARGDAERRMRAALDVLAAAAGADPRDVAEVENNFAWSLNSDGRFAEADPFYRRALERWRALFGENHSLVASGYNNLASNLADQGRYAEAEVLYRKAIAVSVATVGERHVQVARRYNNLSDVLLSLGRKEESRAALRRAYDLYLASYGADHPETAMVAYNMAQAMIADSRPEEGRSLIDAALEVLERKAGATSPITALAVSSKAELLLNDGKKDEALALRRRALANLEQAVGPGHPLLAQSQKMLADMLATLKRPVEAEQMALTAVETARRARTLGVGSSDLDIAKQDSASGRHDEVFAAYFERAWERSDAEPDKTDEMKVRAFLVAQDLLGVGAGRELALAAARGQAAAAGLGAAVRRQQDLVSAARAADRDLLAALAEGRSEDAARRQRDYHRLQAELGKADAELESGFPDYRQLVRPAAMAPFEVQRMLAPDEGLLLATAYGGVINIFVVTKRRVAWLIEDGARALELVRTLRCEVELDACPPDARARRTAALEALDEDDPLPFDADSANALFELLIGQFRDELRPLKRLNVVTTANLGSLPLAMLVTERPRRSGARTAPKWLGDQLALTSLPSVSALRFRTRSARRDGYALVGYGDPVLHGSGASLQVRGGTANAALLKLLEPLPGTRVELSAMRELFGARRSAITLGEAAREPTVRADPRLASARVLVFATHALLPDARLGIGEPGLVLTPPERPGADDDGLLSASEVAQMSFDSDWVILSACNTASPDGQRGSNGLSALARAFLFAGSRALLASHWRVPDDATAALTVETLRFWRDQPGQSRGEALRQAMRAVRTGRRADGSRIPGWTIDWAHPSAWAAFTHIANRDR